jgi:hypothetical protein
LTRSVSGECEGSDYQVDLQSSVANEGFDLVYPVILGNNEITIEDIHTDSLAGEDVKAVLSFTAEAVSDGNNNDVQQICIDIQDIIQAGEIGQTNEQGNSDNEDNNVNDEDGDKQKDGNKKNDRGDTDGKTTDGETPDDDESLSQPTYTAPLNTIEEVSPDTNNPMDAVANY